MFPAPPSGPSSGALLALEQQGADKLFGEPALNLDDLIQTSPQGQGVINILVADQLIQAPSRYATFLLWLLSDLFERLPEVGDPPKPKLIFFFDEAHLLFEDAPKALVDKIEQVVRLIRSKGVGIFFVTQNPLDLPDRVLGQLGNRVQHALRAFTPRDQKAVKAAADTFRANPKVDVGRAITELGVGEAPGVRPGWQRHPHPGGAGLGAAAPEPADATHAGGTGPGGQGLAAVREIREDHRPGVGLRNAQGQGGGRAAGGGHQSRAETPAAIPEEQAGKILLDMGKSAARSAGTQIGRQIMRGILGSIFGKK